MFPPRSPKQHIGAEILPGNSLQFRLGRHGLRQTGKALQHGDQRGNGARIFEQTQGFGGSGAANDISGIKHGNERFYGAIIAYLPQRDGGRDAGNAIAEVFLSLIC